MYSIEEIKQRLTIAELLNRMGLSANGSGFINSIYKEDKTPSMKIYFDENRYWCFATNNGGDIITFYQDYYRVDVAQAIKELAELAGIDPNASGNAIPPAPPKQTFQEEIGRLNNLQDQLKTSLTEYELELYEETYYKNEYPDANEAFRASLRAVQKERLSSNLKIFQEFYNYCQNNINEPAFKYLLKDRSFELDTITKFKICTIKNYFQLNNHLKKTFSIGELQRAGLFSEKGNLIFASHLLVIPYLYNGNIVYLRGRYFDKDNNADVSKADTSYSTNKYMGLRNDKVDLNRTKRFFNYDVVRTMLKGERLYLVEGEFDAMAITQLGGNALAIPGAGNIPEDKYFIPLLEFDIILCMDSDEAGSGLKERLINIFSSYNKKVKSKILPTKDANDFLAGA